MTSLFIIFIVLFCYILLIAWVECYLGVFRLSPFPLFPDCPDLFSPICPPHHLFSRTCPPSPVVPHLFSLSCSSSHVVSWASCFFCLWFSLWFKISQVYIKYPPSRVDNILVPCPSRPLLFNQDHQHFTFILEFNCVHTGSQNDLN